MKIFPYAILVLCLMISCTSNPEKQESFVSDNSSRSKSPNILFLIADDWSYPHAGAYGDANVRTPTFDFIAEEGALFQHAFCASPSCSPSRASVLTGRYPHQNESGGNLWSVFPSEFTTWVKELEKKGYATGKTRKGWAPGNFEKAGYTHNPAGQQFKSFQEFYDQKDVAAPFSFWFGSQDPHRTYVPNTGVETGMKADLVKVPGFMPDIACVRNDILDYYFEVERFDRECGQIIRFLEEKGELDNTLIIMTSDNGMPFPRAKANLYDYGTRMPLAIYWKGKILPGTLVEDFVNFIDFAPTILAAAGADIPESFSGKNLIGTNGQIKGRAHVFIERERHANVRKGDQSYPMRAIRTSEYLYIRNFEPDRWPAGDPSVHKSVGQYGDVDNSIAKFLILDMEGQKNPIDYFSLTFAKRPAEELYAVKTDPFQLNNLAKSSEHQQIKSGLKEQLESWMAETGDRRALKPHTIYYDTLEYVPNYQHKNFDLNQKISDYTMRVMDENMRFKEYPCK